MELKQLRKVKGYTQVEVSELLGIPLRTLKRYETNSELANTFKYNQIYNNLSKIPAKTNLKTQKPLKIIVVGAGYVGLSLAALLSIHHDVLITDIDKEKVNMINCRECYLKDDMLEKIFKDNSFSLSALCVNEVNYQKVDLVIVATNTDFDKATGSFNMESVNSTIQKVREDNKKCLIAIKSTVPMGYVSSLHDDNIIFSPEFLREGNAVRDIMFPSRIIVGADKITPMVKSFARCLTEVSINNKNVVYMSTHEAEAVKLFSNAYLAMRVAYFNELDEYAETNGLDSSTIIKGISLDPRIGDYYNNPSFGYGGYCLPKDTAQLERSFLSISNNNIIRAIVESNETRKEYIVSQIIKKVGTKGVVGFYRLVMKANSDNYRNSSSLDIANKLIDRGIKVLIYEPNYKSENSVSSLEELSSRCDLIVTNRMNKELKPYANKVYTRDQFGKN